MWLCVLCCFFFQAEDGIRDAQESRGLGYVYKRQEYMGQILSVKNSYQYGPICIDKDYRGTEVLPKIFDFSRIQMKDRYPILITFINHINSRSYNAHTKKIGLDVIKSFVFNNNNYYELGYDTSKKVRTIPGNGGDRT
mgnify:CR=1 FL=1